MLKATPDIIERRRIDPKKKSKLIYLRKLLLRDFEYSIMRIDRLISKTILVVINPVIYLLEMLSLI